MCRLLEVHRSGFYSWQKQPLSSRAREDQRLQNKIRQFWMESGCNYGYRNITLNLKSDGETCGKNRVLRLMRGLNIASHRRYRRHKGFPVVTCTVWQRTVWIDNLILRYPIHVGSPTLPMCALKRAGCIPRWLGICFLVESSVGAYSHERPAKQ